MNKDFPKLKDTISKNKKRRKLRRIRKTTDDILKITRVKYTHYLAPYINEFREGVQKRLIKLIEENAND